MRDERRSHCGRLSQRVELRLTGLDRCSRLVDAKPEELQENDS